MPTPLPIADRSVRLAVVGLGQISELCLPPYAARDDVEIVALCDPDSARVDRWKPLFPGAMALGGLETLRDVDADVVDVLVPTPVHGDVVTSVLEMGFHVQVQKPLARTLADADRMLAAAARTGAVLRVLEDYAFYPPLVTLRDLVAGGEIGTPTGLHMKIVATGRGGWNVPVSSYAWQFEQARDGRGMLTFDHGWHQIAVAHWLFGPIARILAWIGESEVAPELAPGLMIDAPATMIWEHANGVRATLEILPATETYFRSEYYTGDERIEVTGSRGFVRCNRISAQGIQEPSVVMYRDGETRSFHAIADTPPDAFAASCAHGIDVFRFGAAPVIDGATAREILRTLLTALESPVQPVVVKAY